MSCGGRDTPDCKVNRNSQSLQLHAPARLFLCTHARISSDVLTKNMLGSDISLFADDVEFLGSLGVENSSRELTARGQLAYFLTNAVSPRHMTGGIHSDYLLSWLYEDSGPVLHKEAWLAGSLVADAPGLYSMAGENFYASIFSKSSFSRSANGMARQVLGASNFVDPMILFSVSQELPSAMHGREFRASREAKIIVSTHYSHGYPL